MTLVVDNRAELIDKPGVHALIVGVSALPHCANGLGPQGEQTFEIRAIAGAAISACEFYTWLVKNERQLPAPLATVRLLVSPSEGAAFGRAEPAKVESFLQALYEWRTDAATNPANLTFFYFAGWGFGAGNDIALVLSDFGRPARPCMWGTVSFDNIYAGMSPSFSDESIARTQFYFVDAGRGYEALAYVSSMTTAFTLTPRHRRDTRKAPVFYSSVAGGLPFARVKGMTLFGEVLLKCLNGEAGEATEEYRGGHRVWRVSVNSLNAALEREFDKLLKSIGGNVPQTYALGGTVKDTTICFLAEPPPMKSLHLDQRKARSNAPGMHVLIAGVSAYAHGRGGHAEPAIIDLGIEQLSSASTSAYLLTRWLLSHQERLSVPLTTLRVLLSPIPEELNRIPELLKMGDHCTLQNFLAAATAWRDDAAKHPESVTLFYFAGHGAQRTKGDSVLLLEDFGDTIGGPLRNAVDMENVFYGMAPSRARKSVARTQLYFVDACRVRPAAFKNYQFMHATSVFDVDELERDDRHAPIFFAATSGSAAYNVPNQQTIFSRILLDCLEGTAARATDAQHSVITVHSLDIGLQKGLQASNSETGADQDYALEGIAKDTTLFSWGR